MKIYIGIDTSKARLDVDWSGSLIEYKNTTAGIKKLIVKLTKLNEQENLNTVVLEASDGYEKNFNFA